MFMQPQQFASQIEFLETGHRQYDVACADECMVQQVPLQRTSQNVCLRVWYV